MIIPVLCCYKPVLGMAVKKVTFKLGYNDIDEKVSMRALRECRHGLVYLKK